MIRSDLGRLTPGPRHQIYLLSEGVFVAAGSGHQGKAKLVSSLPAYLHAQIGRDPIATALHPVVLGEAGPMIRRIQELRFCLAELIPQLRALCGADPLTAPRSLEELVRRAGALESSIAGRLVDEPYTEALAEALDVPCALVARSAIPLERISRRRKSDIIVEVNGRKYRYRLDRTQALSEFLRATEQTLLGLLRGSVARGDEIRREVKDFSALGRTLFKIYRPEKHRNYTVLHHDEDHELQFSRGVWILVRGPLPMRIGAGTICVGLQIRGSSRMEYLSHAPAVGRARDGFWRSAGLLARSGMCMGTPVQYERLLGPRFSDAEAIVHWLDASANLASERSEMHRRWRDRDAEEGGQLRFEMVPF